MPVSIHSRPMTGCNLPHGGGRRSCSRRFNPQPPHDRLQRHSPRRGGTSSGFNPQPPHDRLQPHRKGWARGQGKVSIHSRPMTGCNHCWGRGSPSSCGVSIHSRPHDRLQTMYPLGRMTASGVSIHSRPHDRLQPGCRIGDRMDWLMEFQSTAGPMTGCNPPPSPMPPSVTPRVSIHSRPHDRLQPRQRRKRLTRRTVSIHSRPHDRLQPKAWRRGGIDVVFQSTAGPMTGCNKAIAAEARVRLMVSIHSRPHDRLQQGHPRRADIECRVSIHSRPHDRLQPGAPCQHVLALAVSIHSRPHDRLQPMWLRGSSTSWQRFNPQPAP